MKKKGIDVVWLPISALLFDACIQRSVIAARVRHLTQHFNPEGMGILEVSHRPGSGYFVVDGQHRVVAARTAGKSDLRVQCHVHHDMTLRDEAALFLLLNDARSVNGIDKFRIGLIAGDARCAAIDKAVRKRGFHVASGTAAGSIACIERLFRLYDISPKLLDETLDLIVQAWGTRPTATEQLILAGLSVVLARYNGELDRAVLALKLSKYAGGPSGLIASARGLSEHKPINKTRALAEIVVDTYNKGRRTGALPPL